MKLLTALISGLLFGLGLAISGMADPANVIGFLDVAGNWNPSLAFVMIGAIAVAAPAFAWVRHHPQTLNGQVIDLPHRFNITARLIIGSAVFGVGWGLAGLCPGPALVVAGQGLGYALLFVTAMTIGLLLARRVK